MFELSSKNIWYIPNNGVRLATCPQRAFFCSQPFFHIHLSLQLGKVWKSNLAAITNLTRLFKPKEEKEEDKIISLVSDFLNLCLFDSWTFESV